jgi:putative hydrolase of HD superfamily
MDYNLMTSHRLAQQIAFIIETDKLKSVLRRTRVLADGRCENSAEHSWHIALMAILLAEYANTPVDLLRVVKMLLVHDIVEIDAGDTFAYSGVSRSEQQAKERLAAERLFRLLPADQATELRSLWDEFEASESAEAKFALAMDQLMPALHNYYGNGGTWHEPGVTLERVRKRLGPIGDGSAELWEFVQTLLHDAVTRGMLRP